MGINISPGIFSVKFRNMGTGTENLFGISTDFSGGELLFLLKDILKIFQLDFGYNNICCKVNTMSQKISDLG